MAKAHPPPTPGLSPNANTRSLDADQLGTAGGRSEPEPHPQRPSIIPQRRRRARPRYHDDGQGCASVSQETPRSGPQQQGAKDQSALAPPSDAHAAIATGA